MMEQEKDIVDRLRGIAPDGLELEAADEIEMLRIELDDARFLIRAISDGRVEFRPMPRLKPNPPVWGGREQR